MNSLGHTHVQLTQLLDTRFWLSRQPDTGRRQPGSGTTGQHLARQHGQSTEFDQVRDYQPGDDSRHIDWRATARAGVVQTRLFHRLGALAAQYQNIWLPISDPLEHQLPTSQHLALAGRQGRLQLRHQHQLAHRWQQQASQVRAHWQQLAIRQRAVLLPLTTANSLAQQLASLQEGLRVAGA